MYAERFYWDSFCSYWSFEFIKKGGILATFGHLDIEYRASENYKISCYFAIGKENNDRFIQKCAIHHLELQINIKSSKYQ